MLVMRTTERPAYPLGKLVGSEEPVRLYDLALAMNPLRLYGVQPRAPLRKQAADDPHPFCALLDAAVVPPEPSPDLLGDVPTGVVPDEQQNLLAHLFELLQAPLEKLSRYGRNRSSVYEAHPPAFVLEADGPGAGVLGGHFHQSVAPPFFRSYRGSGEVIHRLARIQRTPSRRESVARIVSPETRSSVSPFSKAASAAIPRVHRLVWYPNCLGERWSIPRNFSARSSSKASRTVWEA